MTNSDGSVTRTRESLLFRLQQAPHDQEAWQRFISRYEPQVLAWCKRWGLQDADAADVTQSLLLQLTKKLPEFQYDPAKRFRGWLKTLAHHAWSDFHRGQKRADVGIGGSAVLATLDKAEAREDLVSRLQESFDLEILESAYQEVQTRVEDRTWQAFVMTAMHGMKGADVAKRLDMGVGAVFMAKSKVQAMLREIIQRAEDES